jgi:CDP-diacylglycerol--glycerol-3-phosphate 3-phosphatidyltransferase
MERETIFDSSNSVTFARIMLVFVIAYLLLLENTIIYLISSVLIFVLIILDGVDGIVARKLNSVTEFGGVLDIVGDRIVENVLWLTFAFAGVIPLWIPIVVLTRSFVIDGFRSYALSKGKTAFGKKSMMKGNIGIFFVSSRLSRALYGIAKTLAFILLALQLYLAGISYVGIEIFKKVTYLVVLFTVAFCIIRGFFTVYDGFKLFTAHRSQ